MVRIVTIVGIAASILPWASATPVPSFSSVLPPSRIASTLTHFQGFLNAAVADNLNFAPAVRSDIAAKFDHLFDVVEGKIPFKPRPGVGVSSGLPHKPTEVPVFVRPIGSILCFILKCSPTPIVIPTCNPRIDGCPLPDPLDWPGRLPPLLPAPAALEELRGLANKTIAVADAGSRAPVAEQLSLSPAEVALALEAVEDFVGAWRAGYNNGNGTVGAVRRGGGGGDGTEEKKRLSFEMTETEVALVAGAVVAVAVCAGSGGLCALALVAALGLD